MLPLIRRLDASGNCGARRTDNQQVLPAQDVQLDAARIL